MASVDDKIVSIKFDNDAFQKKVADTIASLDKLRASLDFANSTRGMNELNAAAKSFDMSHIGTHIEGISAKFLALGTVAVTVLANIASKAVQVGTQMASAFTFSPIVDGFREFETNMNSIQTILANTHSAGTSLDQVNAALQQLNEYSDKTIYNFSQMARNIGTFTAAGVDLDTSVGAIKGIANLAAVSGSSAEQASSVMYQLSQALATGTVRLIDWNSVAAAGIGGEVFKSALFEAGKALGKITDSPVGQTFQQWEDAGHSFRDSLQEGWLTSEVLTTALQGFTGDLTEAQLLSMGYTAEQAAGILEMGRIATAAATEVKTFTQLLGTVKESIATGWADSFRLIIGNFDEAKTLFTGINAAIGGFVQKSADARNDMLSTWRFFGGREKLIEGLKDAFSALANVLRPVRDAFQKIFPPATALTLITLTQKFAEFTEKLQFLTFIYMPRIEKVFRGFFAVLDIGWEIIKNVARVIGTVFGALAGAAGGPVVGFIENLAVKFLELHKVLVTSGGIEKFFDGILGAIQRPIQYLIAFRDAIVDIFTSGTGADVVESAVGRVSDRFSMFGEIIEKVSGIWHAYIERVQAVLGVLDQVWDAIASWFSDLGHRIAETFSAGDFDEAVDLVNVGLLGGILLALRRFLSGGINIDFGGGIMESIRGTLEGLTDTLSAMQAQLRSRTLINIAIAVALLAASVTVLSLIDSAALTRALTAMAIGFGQLMAAMALLSISGMGRTSLRITALAASMILLATAAGILSIAVTNLSQLSWGELARGLTGVTVALTALTASTRLLTEDTDGLIRAGIAMIAMSVGLIVLSIAVKKFAELSWEEMAQGLVGVAGGLGAMVAALKLIPTAELAVTGFDILLISAALVVLSYAVKQFAEMSWAEMGQGLLGVAGGLAAIVLAMRLMPTAELAVSAVGIVLISGAMYIMAKAVQEMSKIPFGDMVKGIAGLAATMLILAVAMHFMEDALPGAAALIVISGALLVLVHVIKELAGLSLAELAMGIGAIAAVLLVLAAAALLMTPLLGSLLGLGAALTLIGLGFALFGAGAFLVAKAFEALAAAGEAGVAVLISILTTLAQALPEIIATLVVALFEAGQEILEAAPLLLDAFKVLLIKILDTIIEVVPKIGEAIGAVVVEGLARIRMLFPQVVATGLAMILALLTGIRNNIHRIVTTATQMISEFARGLQDNMPVLVNAGIMIITSFLNALASQAEMVVVAGLNLLTSLISGIADNIHLVTEAVTNLIISFVEAIVESYQDIIDAGFELLIQFISGIANNVIEVANAVTDIITNFIIAVGMNAQQIIDAGFWLLTTFLSGIGNNLIMVAILVGTLITEFITKVGEQAVNIAAAGAQALIDFLGGIADDMPRVAKAGTDVIVEFIEAVRDNSLIIVRAAADVIVDFIEGLADAIDDKSAELRTAGRHLAGAILDGMTLGLASGAANVVGQARDIAEDVVGAIGDFVGWGSPAELFITMGKDMMTGLKMGMSDGSKDVVNVSETLAKKTVRTFEDSLKKIRFTLDEIDIKDPVITPVLDLTQVKAGAKNLQGLVSVAPVTAAVSFETARTIATTAEQQGTTPEAAPFTGPTEITFNQNNYSPEALSTNDIYKNTKSQIALAREELNIA